MNLIQPMESVVQSSYPIADSYITVRGSCRRTRKYIRFGRLQVYMYSSLVRVVPQSKLQRILPRYEL